MQPIDTHPTFIRQTIDRRRAELLAESRNQRLAATVRDPAGHGPATRTRPSQPGLLSGIARRVRAVLAAAA